jgi:hypothetical protein
MLNFFMAGADLVRWEVESLGNAGPYRLSIHHGRGTIVEYFGSTAEALEREREIEAMFLTPPRPVTDHAC